MTTWILDIEAVSPYFTAWMLTYLVHSSVILGLTCLLWRLLPDSALPTKELLLKVGLVGGLLTASLQIGLGLTPLAGAWELRPGRDSLGTAAASFLPAQDVEASQASLSQRRAASSPSPGSIVSGPESPPPTSTRDRSNGDACIWLNLAWLSGAAFLTAGLLISYLRLHTLLSGRIRLDNGPLFDLLERLVRVTGARRAVRLSSSSRIAVPLARGVVRGEICVPHRAVTELTPEHHEIVLAHELAHLERWDPAWLLVARLIENLCFFQPLNRVVRKHLQEVAEYRCDDRAVQQTGRPITMARVLTELAERSLQGRAALFAPAMASDRSRLGRRIARLVDRDYPRPEDPLSRWLTLGVALTLAALVIAAPGFSIAQGAGESPLPPPSTPVVAEGQSPPVVPSAPETPAEPVPVADAASAAAPLPAPTRAPDLVPGIDPIELEFSIAFEAAVEPVIADIQGTVELAMAALEKDLAIQLEPFDEELSVRLKALEEVLDPEFEALTHEMTLLAAELAAQASHLVEAAAPTEEQMQAFQLEAQRLAEIELPREEVEQLQERVRDLAERARPSREEFGRIRERARELADSYSMDEEVLAEIRERARTLAEQTRPSREQLEQLHDRIRETIDEWQAERLRHREEREGPESSEPQQQ